MAKPVRQRYREWITALKVMRLGRAGVSGGPLTGWARRPDRLGGMPANQPSPLTTADAVAASVACARAVGLSVDHPEVIAEGYSVRVHLHPAPVVSRVVTLGRELRGHPRPWLEREVAVGMFLSASPVDVVAPWDAPGPHVVDGRDVSLWRWVEHVPGTVSGTDFGTMLEELHATLASYDADLPPLVGPLMDVAEALTRSDDRVLHRAAEELVPLARSWHRRPLHGDAHTGNVLMTPTGPRWTDFEDVCVGPIAWDLASMTVTEEAIAAYPGHVDRARLEECRDLRRLQILASLLVGNLDEAELYESLTVKLQRRL